MPGKRPARAPRQMLERARRAARRPRAARARRASARTSRSSAAPCATCCSADRRASSTCPSPADAAAVRRASSRRGLARRRACGASSRRCTSASAPRLVEWARRAHRHRRAPRRDLPRARRAARGAPGHARGGPRAARLHRQRDRRAARRRRPRASSTRRRRCARGPARRRLRVLHERSFIDDPTRLLRLARYQRAPRLRDRAPHRRAGARSARRGRAGNVSGARIGAELRLALREADARRSR